MTAPQTRQEECVVLYDRQIAATTGQCDCACQLAVEKQPVHASLSADQVDLATLRRSDYYALELDDTYTVCHNAPYPTAVLNRPAWNLLKNLDHCSTFPDGLSRATIDRFLATGLLVPAGVSPTAVCSDTLSMWLHCTDRCNLRCDPCYLPHAPIDMPLSIARAAIASALRSALAHGYRAIKIKYAGGEPLLRFPWLLQVHDDARSLTSRYDVALDAILLSNGTLLTAAMVEQMQATGLRLMRSLDGVGEYHDCHRHYADGSGSFDDVARAVDLALAGGLVPDISITVSGRNVEGLPQVVAWVLERGLPFSLNFYRQGNGAFDRPNLRLEEQRVIESVLKAYQEVEANLPRYSLLASLADRANLAVPHNRPCASGQDYLVFDARGNIARCQMDMANSVTDCWAPDPLKVVRESEARWVNPSVEDKEACRECRWRYYCAGGCPLQAHRATGRSESKSPYCSMYKGMFPEIIRLEGLRILKYA